ncbi:hypothetical protein ACJX0J_006389, partial [Zea mays]
HVHLCFGDCVVQLSDELNVYFVSASQCSLGATTSDGNTVHIILIILPFSKIYLVEV